MRFFRWLSRLVRRPVFIVHLHDGHATAERGNLSVAFLAACSDLAKKRGLEGRLYGIWKEGSTSLEFSKGILEEHHQVFRNVWGVHRRRHK